MKRQSKAISNQKNVDKQMKRLHRGFGSIRYLGEGRSKAYAVHPPSKRNEDGSYVRPKAICYVSDWYVGFAVLAAWHAGVYKSGMEEKIQERLKKNPKKTESVSELSLKNTFPQTPDELYNYCMLLQQYIRNSDEGLKAVGDNVGENDGGKTVEQKKSLTVKEVYEKFYESKYGRGAPRTLSESSAAHTRSNFKKLSGFEDRKMDDITIDELQEFVNSINLKRTVVLQTIILIKQLYDYAMAREYCTRNPAKYIKTPDLQEYTHHQDFTDEELRILWGNSDDPIVKMVLIMCYSGFRLSAYEKIEIHLDEKYFMGGAKTEAGRGRIVPIHSGIFELVKELVNSENAYFCCRGKDMFYRKMRKKLVQIGIDTEGRYHTPHSCRHTFSRLCESYGVREADRKRLMGHSFGSDITNGVYGHRTLEELRVEIEKIQCP